MSGDLSRAVEWFHRLAALDAGSRGPMQAELTAEDPALAREVESLLAAHDSDGAMDRLAEYLAPADPSSGSCVPDGLTGTRVAQYEVGELIGRGGMGDVYRARDTRLGRWVALKFLPAWLDRDPSLRDRFVIEARSVSSIDHTNVCALHDLGETADGRLFLIMPYYEGETLKQRLARGPLGSDAAARIALQTACGLAAAHERGVIHRDIKPSNLLLTGHDHVKILDFGVAKLDDVTLTGTGETPGTMSYMSPEQRASGEVDARSDLWSLGAVLYEMLIGTRPGGASSIATALEKVPCALSEVVTRLLAESPEDRYPEARAVAEDLAVLADGTGVIEARTAPKLKRFLGPAGIMGGALLAAGAWWVLADNPIVVGRRGETSSGGPVAGIDPAPGVAVLPFRTTGVDTAVWREGMVDLLSFNLDGVPGLRKIDPMAVLSAWRRAAADVPSPGSGGELSVARSVGAAYAITGSVVRLDEAGDLRLRADVYDVATSSLRGSAQVDGKADSVVQLVDDLTVEILRGSLIPVSGELPLVNLSRATTSSLPALKAYLAGEDRFRRGRYSGAVLDFQRAVELDSTFARALFRLANAYGWSGDDRLTALQEETYDRARRFADRLPERDAMLIRFGGDHWNALTGMDTFTARYPDDADGWYALGEARYHTKGATLLPARLYREAFERAVELAPHYEEPYFHLIEDAFARLDRERVRELLAAYDSLDREGSPCPGYRLVYDLRWGDTATQSRALTALDTASRALGSCTRDAIAAAPLWVDRAARLDQERFGGPPGGPWLLHARAWLGHLDAVRAILTRKEIPPRSVAAAAGLRVMLHLSGYPEEAASLDEAVAMLAESPIWPMESAASYRGFLINYFWMGALALAEGRRTDLDRATRAIEELARPGRWENPNRADSVAAYGLALREFARIEAGDPTRLPELLAATEKLPVESLARFPALYLRYEAGKWLLSQGRLPEAEQYFLSLYPDATPYFVPAQYYLGRVYEQGGDVEEARSHYRLFVTWWENADPELQPLREEGIAALARLAPDS